MKPSLPREIPSDDPVPGLIQGYVSVQGPSSVFGKASDPPTTSKPFHAKKADRDQVRRNLEKDGFTICAESALGMAVAGPPSAFEALTGGKVITREVLLRAESGISRYVTHLDVVGTHQLPTLGVAAVVKSKAAKIDGVLLERPRVFLAMFPSPIPPSSPRFHLELPSQVSAGLSAVEAQQQGLSGAGVQVAMPDSGWYRHPYFTAQHYNVKTPITVIPGTNPSKDPVGHGTGESANLLAVAPGVVLQPIRTANDNGDLVAAVAGFLKAKELAPAIITNSWGSDTSFPPPGPPDQYDQAIALEIQDAIERGIIVVFSAGNGQFSIEPQVPGVLAAGGVYMSNTMELQASNYASGYKSPWFDDVVVPTVCGLVGLLPRAQYLMLPIPPGCQLDREEGQPEDDDPEGDGTGPDDGWALFSGTSAAAPQLAGAVALLLEGKPGLTPAQVAEALRKTAIDITTGSCHPRFNNPATVGADLATGDGLVNVAAAVQYAKTNF
jgi:hypothetical protein